MYVIKTITGVKKYITVTVEFQVLCEELKIGDVGFVLILRPLYEIRK